MPEEDEEPVDQTGETFDVEVRLPPLIATLYPDAPRRLQVQAGSVREVLLALDAMWPGMWDCFCDSRPAIRRHINVFVGSRRASLGDLLEAGEGVTILTAISGG